MTTEPAPTRTPIGETDGRQCVAAGCTNLLTRRASEAQLTYEARASCSTDCARAARLEKPCQRCVAKGRPGTDWAEYPSGGRWCPPCKRERMLDYRASGAEPARTRPRRKPLTDLPVGVGSGPVWRPPGFPPEPIMPAWIPPIGHQRAT